MNLHRSLAPADLACWRLQVWGWTVPQLERLETATVVLEAPSVGVDSSLGIGHAGRRTCWRLQVWGWTVPVPRDAGFRSRAGGSKCGGGQFRGVASPAVDSRAGGSKCGGGQFLRVLRGYCCVSVFGHSRAS